MREPTATDQRGIYGVQHHYEFPNGWGASVVRGPYSYGGPEGLWELAVCEAGKKGPLRYDSGLTDDVIGWLTEDEVDEWLTKIEALPQCVPQKEAQR